MTLQTALLNNLRPFRTSNILEEYSTWCSTVGHFKNTEVFIFGDALGFSIVWSIWCPLVGTILSKIYQYLDLPHRLWSFRVNVGGPKIQNVKIKANVVLILLNDERIPNLALKFKSKNIWPPFWAKNCWKLVEYQIYPIFEFLAHFFGPFLAHMMHI